MIFLLLWKKNACFLSSLGDVALAISAVSTSCHFTSSPSVSMTASAPTLHNSSLKPFSSLLPVMQLHSIVVLGILPSHMLSTSSTVSSPSTAYEASKTSIFGRCCFNSGFDAQLVGSFPRPYELWCITLGSPTGASTSSTLFN